MTIGNVYTLENLTNLLNFSEVGNWSLNSGILSSVGSNSILEVDYTTALEKFSYVIKTTSKDLVIRLNQINTNNIDTILSINGSGNLKIENTYFSTNEISLDTLIYNTNDSLIFTYTRDIDLYIFSVENETTSQIVSLTSTIPSTCIHKIQLYSANSIDVSSISYSSEATYNVDVLVVGDSITWGGHVTNVKTDRWVSLCGFEALSSPGDTSIQALELINEIVNVVNPKKVIYAMGTNDRNDLTTWYNNLINFKNQLNNYSIDVLGFTPYANNYVNMSTFQTEVKDIFTQYYEVFNATKDVNNDLISSYDNGDGIHLNDAGHLAVSQAVNNGTINNKETKNTSINIIKRISILKQII